MLVEQIDLHLVVVEVTLALAHSHHLQLLHIGGIELLGLLEQVVDVDTQGCGHIGRVGIIAEAGLPEHEEVLTLLHAPERPLGIVAQHVVYTFLETFVPRAGTGVFVEVLHLRAVHDMHSIGILVLVNIDDRDFVATTNLNLRVAVELRVVLRQTERHLHLTSLTSIHCQGDPLNLGIGGTGGHIADAGRPIVVGSERDGALHLVPFHRLI